MSIENSTEPGTPRGKISFGLDFNLGHLFVIFSLFLSAAGLYAHDESRLSVLENKVLVLDSGNLGNRMSVNEAKVGALADRLDGILGVLTEIRNELAESHKATVNVLSRVETRQQKTEVQQQKTEKAVKNRIFP